MTYEPANVAFVSSVRDSPELLVFYDDGIVTGVPPFKTQWLFWRAEGGHIILEAPRMTTFAPHGRETIYFRTEPETFHAYERYLARIVVE